MKYVLKTNKNIEDILSQWEIACHFSIEHEHSCFEYSLEIQEKEFETLCLNLLQKGIDASVELLDYEEIDWIEQAKAFAPAFKDGLIEIDLQKYAPHCSAIVRLLPRHAFGDCSHPTTVSVLEMMARFVKNKIVIDIGTGSAILSIAAIHLGAFHAYGIDIDKDALVAAKENVLKNNLQEKIEIHSDGTFLIDEEIPCIVICNMIFSEMQIAFQTHKNLIEKVDMLILSGFFSFELEKVRNWLLDYSIQIAEISTKSDWLCLQCKKL